MASAVLWVALGTFTGLRGLQLQQQKYDQPSSKEIYYTDEQEEYINVHDPQVKRRADAELNEETGYLRKTLVPWHSTFTGGTDPEKSNVYFVDLSNQSKRKAYK